MSSVTHVSFIKPRLIHVLSVVFGFLGAIVLGGADFFGGLGSQHLGSLRVTWLSMFAGILGFVGYFVFSGGNWAQQASPSALILGGLSGLVLSFALVFLYASLALGPMSILSPLGALVAAVVPVLWDFASGTQLSLLDDIALGIALVAVVLIAIVREEKTRRPGIRGILFAVSSGTLIGAYMILISLTPPTSGVIPFVANRVVAATVLSVIVAVSALWAGMRKRQQAGMPRADVVVGERGEINWRVGIWLAVAAGLTETVGDIFVIAGLRLGELSIVSVLTAMYPAGTILLATLFLKERLSLVQGIGLVLALAAAAMLALG